jgi:hypothetical protein
LPGATQRRSGVRADTLTDGAGNDSLTSGAKTRSKGGAVNDVLVINDANLRRALASASKL